MVFLNKMLGLYNEERSKLDLSDDDSSYENDAD